MPKRIIDGEGLWGSDKIAEVLPEEFRAEYANLLPLAMANGVFEVNPRRVWGKVYFFNRPSITPEIVEAILAEFHRVRLLFRWKTPDGKEWGYWTGIHKPGRLPSAYRLKKRHELVGPEPPKEELQQFLSGQVASGQPMASHEAANGCLGFGVGVGSGSGINPSSNSDESDQHVLAEDFQSTNLDQSLEAVWTYYMATIGRNPKQYTWSPPRKTMGKARLRDLWKRSGSLENAVELMKLCIDRLKLSAFHNGANSQGKKYIGWEHLFRSTEQMEKWLNDDAYTTGAANGD